ncbi:MAG: hypothetical protein Q9208_003763 [Pyrenodesmia sp. 3 TL-2023]
MPWIGKFQVDDVQRTVTIRYAPGECVETMAIHEQLEKARESDSFEILRSWRDELYLILGVDREVRMARGGSALFGIHTIGVHMMAFCRNHLDGIKLWIPRRAATKQTYPGMLDNTVGGGIVAGEDPFDCLLREAREEASFPEHCIRNHAKAVGTISYFHVRDARAGGEVGLLQPATQYLYDMELPGDMVPKPSDAEVQEFLLWSLAETMAALREGQFKPNSAVALIDFFIRHGYITARNEPEYRDLVSRIHRRLHY